jgi:hypothetical protein
MDHTIYSDDISAHNDDNDDNDNDDDDDDNDDDNDGGDGVNNPFSPSADLPERKIRLCISGTGNRKIR